MHEEYPILVWSSHLQLTNLINPKKKKKRSKWIGIHKVASMSRACLEANYDNHVGLIWNAVTLIKAIQIIYNYPPKGR